MSSGFNVLVYSGDGAGPDSAKFAVKTLRAFLGHRYAVREVDSTVLKSEPWEGSTAMVVFPGGRDLPYVRDMAGVGIARLKDWVHKGGRYIGFCAGGYFATSYCEFEPGTDMEVLGFRELKFYPDACRGTTYPGYDYKSDNGSRPVSVKVNRELFKQISPKEGEQIAERFNVYFNGGGFFINAHELSKEPDHKVDILAEYPPDVPDPLNRQRIITDAVAVVGCHVGRGRAVLTGIHPEAVTADMDPDYFIMPHNRDMIPKLKETEEDRLRFLYLMLRYLGLSPKPPAEAAISLALADGVPLQTPTFLTYTPLSGSAQNSTGHSSMASALVGATDPETSKFKDLEDSVHVIDVRDNESDRTLLSNSVHESGSSTPTVVICPPNVYPEKSATPNFEPSKCAEHLKEKGVRNLGSWMMYTDTTTSTQSFLEKNLKFQRLCPNGLVNVASHQTSARGRGGNVWVSPAGCLQFTTLIRHPISPTHSVVFIQYLMGLAVVEAVRSRPGYEQVPLRLKWPNDIYAKNLCDISEDDSSSSSSSSSSSLMFNGHSNGYNGRERSPINPKGYVKIGGVLVTSSVENGEFVLLIGTGVNTNNPLPTTSINHVIDAYNVANRTSLEKISMEDMLASTLHAYESDQVVSLKEQNYRKVRVTGIAPDSGMLVTEAIDQPGLIFTLQPDGNSFDMMNGLIGRKTQK
ncbi:biotin holocarboxylase synthetase [Mycoemilia scoparia]|uniref:Biotin holocarboxylase synthetase n=1 Tax=Mycoemilia scoparia TaxID=417184 RepID=A0A9W7ZW38_9FUNG|nr:biotin holocarboxylase synthetase [Mycoemilia scoparia]